MTTETLLFMKVCTKCTISKALADFYNDKRASDGKTSDCRKCHNLIVMVYARANPDKARIATKKWRELNPGACKESNSAWRKANKEKLSENQKRYASNNPEKILDNVKKYASANRGKMNAKKALHEAQKIQATPLWSNNSEIGKIYKKAIDQSFLTGERYEVDHIVPLRGKTVCGLHVQQNLQIITKVNNMKKSNSFWPDMP